MKRSIRGDHAAGRTKGKEDIYCAEGTGAFGRSCAVNCAKLRLNRRGNCPKCPGKLESLHLRGISARSLPECGGFGWTKANSKAIVRLISPRPLGAWLDTLTAKTLEREELVMRSAMKKQHLVTRRVISKGICICRGAIRTGVIQCSGCGAFHHRRHWTLNAPGSFSRQIIAISFSVPRAGRFRIGFRAVNSPCATLKRESAERLRASCATKSRGRGRKIRWSGLCAWMRRTAAGGSRPRPRSSRSGWDARLRRLGVESSLTSGGIIISSSVWCGTRAGPAGLNRGERKDGGEHNSAGAV